MPVTGIGSVGTVTPAGSVACPRTRDFYLAA
jgi:hypothetical protein